jgi:hypothetical protein
LTVSNIIVKMIKAFVQFALVALLGWRDCEAVLCYSCQYSSNPSLIGYECVTSPADYTGGPTTTECDTGCQTEVHSIDNWNSIWFILRGCKTKEDGCTSGSANVCIETCTEGDLCNSKSYAPSSVATSSTASTTTTTEPPGTRSCYSCVYSYNPDVSDVCVTDAASVPPPSVVRCHPSRVCTIFRQWDKGGQVVRSFARGCEEQRGAVDNCLEDTFFITCNTYCTTEFCNEGPGLLPLTKGLDELSP